MPSPSFGEELAREVVKIYTAAEVELTRLVADRLARGLQSPSWAEQKLAQTVRLQREARKVMSRVAVRNVSNVTDLMELADRIGREEALREIKKAIAAGAGPRLGSPDVPIVGAGSRAAVARLAEETIGVLNSSHVAILRGVDDAYRKVIAEVSGSIVSGTATRRAATQAAVNRFANAGISMFVDQAGRRWGMDTYSEMATRTSAGRAALNGHWDQIQAVGHDLVQVSDSPEECPVCRPWEGRILSISGRTPGKPTVSQASSAGLFHPNCTHSTGLYVEGFTSRPKPRGNPEGYENRQEQRRLERGVRQWKRREAAAITPEAKVKARGKVREWQGKLRDQTEASGLPRLYYREAPVNPTK